jgi:hypothetical protein
MSSFLLQLCSIWASVLAYCNPFDIRFSVASAEIGYVSCKELAPSSSSPHFQYAPQASDQTSNIALLYPAKLLTPLQQHQSNHSGRQRMSQVRLHGPLYERGDLHFDFPFSSHSSGQVVR